jgi:hypothetical protein
MEAATATVNAKDAYARSEAESGEYASWYPASSGDMSSKDARRTNPSTAPNIAAVILTISASLAIIINNSAGVIPTAPNNPNSRFR